MTWHVAIFKYCLVVVLLSYSSLKTNRISFKTIYYLKAFYL